KVRYIKMKKHKKNKPFQAFEWVLKFTTVKLPYPSLKLCTDNAAMIGCVGYYDYIRGYRSTLDLNGVPNLKIGERYSKYL
ncbi:hypothetical protein SAMN05446037_102370, partial [Anaerovirgula multivorans]